MSANDTFRKRIGEAAYAEYMQKLRAKRKRGGGAWRLDYVDQQGRTGSELAAAAGRAKRTNYKPEGAKGNK